jgi:hypothetical protein
MAQPALPTLKRLDNGLIEGRFNGLFAYIDAKTGYINLSSIYYQYVKETLKVSKKCPNTWNQLVETRVILKYFKDTYPDRVLSINAREGERINLRTYQGPSSQDVFFHPRLAAHYVAYLSPIIESKLHVIMSYYTSRDLIKRMNDARDKCARLETENRMLKRRIYEADNSVRTNKRARWVGA